MWKVMQYTGLKDKYGTEIYEGDILKQIHSNKKEVVQWKSSLNGYDIDGWLCRTFSIRNKLQEVIGNIYENNYLLTAEMP
jgi:hypothetical protein